MIRCLFSHALAADAFRRLLPLLTMVFIYVMAAPFNHTSLSLLSFLKATAIRAPG
jgi:hypothetical protein